MTEIKNHPNNHPKLPHVVIDEKTGKETVLPGYYPSLENDDYHNGPGFSSTNIKIVAKSSPFHLWDAKINPDQDEEEVVIKRPGAPMDARQFGNAYHTLVLEPHEFVNQYVQEPEMPEGVTTRMNAGKEYLKDFAEKHIGKLVICEADLVLLKKMAERVKEHPRSSKVLEVGKGIIESSFFHIDEETGVLVKIRPDYMRKGKYIADLKSTIGADEDGFSKHISNYGYHISAAMYLEVFKAVTGEDYRGKFVFVAQEKNRPFAIANYVISDEALALGAEIYRKSLRKIAHCIEKYGDDPWDSYPGDIQQIDIPHWAYKKA